MWEVTIVAPNGLTFEIKLDEYLTSRRSIHEIDAILQEIRPKLEELVLRKAEKNPDA